MTNDKTHNLKLNCLIKEAHELLLILSSIINKTKSI